MVKIYDRKACGRRLKTEVNNRIKFLTGTPGFIHTTKLPAHRIFCGRNE